MCSALSHAIQRNLSAALRLLYLALSDSESRVRRVAYCLLDFILLASPGWVRNILVRGEPFFTYCQWAIYFPVTGRNYSTTLLHLFNPTPDSPLAMDPLDKVRILLPLLILNWPLAAANLSACVGLGIACVKRNALGIGFAGLAVARQWTFPWRYPEVDTLHRCFLGCWSWGLRAGGV